MIVCRLLVNGGELKCSTYTASSEYRTEVFLCVLMLTEAIFVAFPSRRKECWENNLLSCTGKTATPAQDKLSKEISDMKTHLASLTALKNTGLSLVKPEKNKELKKSIDIKEMQLKRSE